MTQNEKDLLLKDLCARQMNGVKCKVFNDAKPYILSGILHNKPYGQLYFDELDRKEFDGFVSVKDCKPYLFPLSSMTEEQEKEFNSYVWFDGIQLSWESFDGVMLSDIEALIDFFHKNHIDYRGLIEKGLANDATGLNIY